MKSQLSLVALVLVGCTRVAPVAVVALEGDLAELKKALAPDDAFADRLETALPGGQAVGPGGMSGADSRRLARAVLLRQLASPLPGEEFERFGQVRGCASSLQGPLSIWIHEEGRRADAARWLVAQESLVDAPAAGWSTVRAEKLVRQMEAPEVAQRRGALVQALWRGSPSLVSALHGAARYDPEPHNRQLAIQALGALSSERSVEALAQLWSSASTDEKRYIVRAWARAARRQSSAAVDYLVHVAEGAASPDSVGAASLLARRNEAPTAFAVEVLRSALRGPDAELKLQVLLESPQQCLAGPLRSELARLAQDTAPLVAAHAIECLTRTAAPTQSQLQRLEQLEASDDHAQARWVARLTLLRLEHPTGRKKRAELVAQGLLSNAAADTRLTIARFVLDWRGWAFAVPSLADDSPRVRTEMACRLLESGQPDQGVAAP